MSILQSARQQHEKPSSAFEASLGRGVERERRWLGPVLAWVLGMPLCLALGAGSNYAWHWRNNKPIEQKVEVRTETPLPYRVAETQQEFSTQPFPAAPEAPVTSTASTPKVTTVMPPAPEDADPLAGMDTRGASSSLVQRLRQAVQQPAPEVQAVPDGTPPAAAALADLPPAVSSRVPALRYSSHVYSSSAANRIITINGRDYREGDEVAPGVKLLQIQPEYSIFRVGGQSFSLQSLTDWPGAQ